MRTFCCRRRVVAVMMREGELLLMINANYTNAKVLRNNNCILRVAESARISMNDDEYFSPRAYITHDRSIEYRISWANNVKHRICVERMNN